MEERVCPRCKSTSYTNPNLKLLVNTCGHRLCQTCVDVLFTRPSSACPECHTPLRRADFRLQQFEDSLVEREVDIRKKILKIYNKREHDFQDEKDPLLAYNNYLEEVETIVWNLANNIDADVIKKKVEKFKKENDAAIRKNNSKLMQEEVAMMSKLELEKKEAYKRQKDINDGEKEAVSQKKKDRNALLNDLTYANAPAGEILARHRHQKEKEAEEKKSLLFSSQQSALKASSKSSSLKPIKTAEPYIYKPIVVENNGPQLPSETQLSTKMYLQHVRSASGVEKASGYSEILACQRAIEEAFDCLYM